MPTKSSPRESRLTSSKNSSKPRTFNRPEETLTSWSDSSCHKQHSQLQDEVGIRAIATSNEGEHSKDGKIQWDRSQKSQIYLILLR